MNDPQKYRKQEGDSAPRVAYNRPQLKVFGSVGALTQGGSTGMPEIIMLLMNPNRQMT